MSPRPCSSCDASTAMCHILCSGEQMPATSFTGTEQTGSGIIEPGCPDNHDSLRHSSAATPDSCNRLSVVIVFARRSSRNGNECNQTSHTKRRKKVKGRKASCVPTTLIVDPLQGFIFLFYTSYCVYVSLRP